MKAAQKKKVQEFLKDPRKVARFKNTLRGIEFNALVRPGSHPAAYKKEYLIKTVGRKYPLPFLDHDFHIKCIAAHVESAVAGEILLHPVLAYASLFDLRSSYVLKKAGKRKRLTEKELLAKKRFGAIQKIMNRLHVPAYMKRAKSEFDIKESSVRAFEEMYSEYYRLRMRVQTLESDVAVFSNPDYVHGPLRDRLQKMQADNSDLAQKLVKEQNRADVLESEIARLTDHIISQPAEGELDSIKREYNVLSQKCDALVTRNIELSNRLRDLSRSKQLEEILNAMRDRINNTIRSGIHESPDAMIKSIQEEINQLKRARIYLGKALYDVAILYHRKGDREKAMQEMRAARELGVKDADVENILKPG